MFSSSGKSSPVSSTDKATPERPKKARLRRAAAMVYQSLLRQATVADVDDDESDSNDETFEGGEQHSSDEEPLNGLDDSSNDGELGILLIRLKPVSARVLRA